MARGVPETHPEERGSLKWSTKANWVTKAGGLPDYIESVAVALVRGGMPRERAIPTAVNVVRKTCATGLWGGRPNAKVSPAIRAAACKAAAEWEAKKGGAKLSATGRSKSLDLAGPIVTSKAGQPVTVNALTQGMRPRHVKALAKANRNLQRSGMPVAKRRKVLRSMAKGLRSGKVSLSVPLAGSRAVDLAFNPGQLRVSAGKQGGGQWTLGSVSQVAAVSASQQGQKITPGGSAPTDPRQIQALQKQLGLPVTGVYDQRTRDAVAAFQRAYGLKVDGIAGRQTLGTLHAARVASGHAAKGGRGRSRGRSAARTSARHAAALARHAATVRARQQRQRQAAAKRKAREKQAQRKALAAVNAQRARNRGLPSNPHMRALALRSKTASNSKARVQAARALAKIIRLHGSARTKARRQAASTQRGQARQAAASLRARAAAATGAARRQAASARASAAATARAQRQQATAAKKAQAQRARSARAMSRPARIVTGAPKRAATPRKLVSRL